MFFGFAGIDGSGKSTQLELAKAALTQAGYEVFISKAYTDALKQVLGPLIKSWDDTAIIMLFQAMHAQQRSLAAAALASGQLVLADRWDESYLAYHQNFGPLANDSYLRQALNHLAFGYLRPRHTLLLDVDPEQAAARRRERQRPDTFDNRGLAYFETIRCSYQDLAAERGWTIVDASRCPQEVHEEVMRHIWALVEQ